MASLSTIVATFSLTTALIAASARADLATCAANRPTVPATGDRRALHFTCACEGADRAIAKGDGDDFFSLADFARGLPGHLFARPIFVTFRRCRRLRVRLDQLELTRIGSPFFRPDMQVSGRRKMAYYGRRALCLKLFSRYPRFTPAARRRRQLSSLCADPRLRGRSRLPLGIAPSRAKQA